MFLRVVMNALAAMLLVLTLSAQIGSAQAEYVPTLAAIAQYATAQLSKRVDSAASAVKDYYDATGHLPSNTSEIDDFLMSNYSNIVSETLPSGASVQGEGSYRKLPGLRVCIDSQAASLSKVNDSYQFPSAWSAEPNDVVITLDGDGTYVIWSSDFNGRPGQFYKIGHLETRQPVYSASKSDFNF